MTDAASYVPRQRLIAPLLAAPVGLVEAGAGYGKSVLAAQCRRAAGVASAYVPLGETDQDGGSLAASIFWGLAGSGLSDLVAAVDGDDPATRLERLLDVLSGPGPELLLIVDDAHHITDPEAIAAISRLAERLPDRHRLLIAARSFAGAGERIWGLDRAVRIDTAALAFTAHEAAELIALRSGRRPTAHEVDLLLEETHGWATALVLAAGSPASANVARVGEDPVGSRLRGILVRLSGDDRRALAQLGHLPLLSSELCDLITGRAGALRRLVHAGIPLARNESGWWELPGPVAEQLAAHAPLSSETAVAAAEAYVRDGALLPALRVLIRSGCRTEAAATLASTPPNQVERLGLATLREFIEALGDSAVCAHPRALLHLARAAEVDHQAQLRASALSRAGRIVARAGPDADPRLARELDAELARDLVWDEATRGEAAAVARSVLETAGEDELMARARALDVLGRLASYFSPDGPRPEGDELLQEAARLARRAGQRTWAAQALVPLAVGSHCAQCRYERALGVLDQALADLPARNRYRALVLSFRADTLIEVGRGAEAEGSIAEMRELGRWSGEEWMLAYASWTEAILASFRGDAAATVAAVVDAERHTDNWFQQPSGVEFLAQTADCLARVGEGELALAQLARARARSEECQSEFAVFEAAVEARVGDAAAAERALDALLHGARALTPQDRWPLELLRAHVALRLGAPAAGSLAARAFEQCLRIGHPDGPLLREPAIARPLLRVAAAAGSRAAAALLGSGGSVAIRLLGGFEVTRAGHPVALPVGRPAKAVRAVAVAGGQMHTEELIELLWPEADPDVGRPRLRNLLSRLRSAAGELLVRDGEAISLVREAEVDATSFEAEADAFAAARAAGERSRAAALARAALARYGGELLPEDRFEPWAAAPRERLRLGLLAVLDFLSDEAERDGEVDEAARLISRALDVEPYDECRYLRLALVLAKRGQAGSARAVLRRARAALAQLGIEPSVGLAELEAELGDAGLRDWAGPRSAR
ncbi:MAG: BTAD domain-containing putative transcriptional regulator [Solirubrobacteraceae bacterium]